MKSNSLRGNDCFAREAGAGELEVGSARRTGVDEWSDGSDIDEVTVWFSPDRLSSLILRSSSFLLHFCSSEVSAHRIDAGFDGL